MSERTYSTGGTDHGSVSYLPSNVADLAAIITKVTITADGKLQIVLEGAITDEETLNQVRSLLVSQRGGQVSVDITGNQGELDL